MFSHSQIEDEAFENMPSLGKRYYSIGEVADLLEVEPSVIRYWENEFPLLHIRRNANGERRFTEEDIRMLKLIHYLLKRKGFTIEGANRYLSEYRQEAHRRLEVIESLKKFKSFLQMLRNELP